MPSLRSLRLYLNLPHLLLLFTALYTTLTSAASCISTNEINICCPGSLFGGLTSGGNGKPTAHGICCIDPSTIRRRSIDDSDDNIIVINEALHRRQADRVDINPTTCSENHILIPLSATDYSQKVSSVMASISSGGSGDPSSTNTGTAAPTGAATTTGGESSSAAVTTTATTTTPSSTGGMPAATGQRSYVAVIGGVVAAAVLVAGGL
ncbi:hypothetical protein RJZ56_006075 [Blastomyces dermatitidis]|uniref:GPI anchored protein n=1 Tax=Ajellomyces dermatitidis (strain ATCC 18188 / CBS 674.68) TaxID=653446 RepID=F2T457_AJEDA|nr:hypothetical protein BDDG_00653 [Blastomyces dermatitidis ATCC 18188]EQL32699.1 hypothetical protein BDFG_05231 [Blastomyces dermatitidis ATCC 26199]